MKLLTLTDLLNQITLKRVNMAKEVFETPKDNKLNKIVNKASKKEDKYEAL